MGTRADFYLGRGLEAEWLGSIAWDGYPEGLPEHLLRIDKPENFRAAVEQFIEGRSDGTKPADGWPWPWEDSNTTDYAYAFDDGAVWYSIGYPQAWWWKATDENPPDEEDEDYQEKLSKLTPAVFPKMKDRQNVTLGKRSGIMIIGIE